MAPSEDAPPDAQSENSEKLCKGCRYVARSGFICTKCSTVTHFGCAKRVKKCCGETLSVNVGLESVNECSSENIKLLRELVEELKKNNKLLYDKVDYLEEKVETLEGKLSEKTEELNKVSSSIKKPYSEVVNANKNKIQKVGNHEGKLVQQNTLIGDVNIKNDSVNKNTEEAGARIIEASVQNKPKANDLKKFKKKVIYGTAKKNGTEIGAYMPKSKIHVSKLNLSVTKENIITFIKGELPDMEVNCEELNVKSKAYRSFK
ncbi:unnamed protein product [Brassicogethes aeneus]|uniref:Phorbol-ester/DAG-type domain-containing protein n=1 Tax=Brassicogethes aeneus TaxID=1431903 RepID=A0A9P0BCY4_BRAAE|nr:unnamed protein product [Brassicogethes aeneus]